MKMVYIKLGCGLSGVNMMDKSYIMVNIEMVKKLGDGIFISLTLIKII